MYGWSQFGGAGQSLGVWNVVMKSYSGILKSRNKVYSPFRPNFVTIIINPDYNEYTMSKLTGGDARKAFELMQISKSDPQAAYSRILLGLQKQNKEAFDEEKMTDEEMRQAAKDSVTSFREEMFDKLLGKQESPAPAQNNNDPMGLL